jgi:hypothetical protein
MATARRAHRIARLGTIAPWLVAVASCCALLILLLAPLEGRPARRTSPAAPRLTLPAQAGAGAVESMFRRMTPYAVQKDMGASKGKAADCSIYSDGDLDNGVDVTWAVTLCVVHPLDSAS